MSPSSSLSSTSALSLFNTQSHFSIHPSLAMFLLLLLLSFCLFAWQQWPMARLTPVSFLKECCCMKTHPYLSFLPTIPQNSVLPSTLFYPCCSPLYCIPPLLSFIPILITSQVVFLLFPFIPITNKLVHTVLPMALYYPQMINI